MNLEQKALEFAREAHGRINQKRKYTGEDYIVHPIAVAEIVKSVTNDEDIIAAAYLHDTSEDINPIFPNEYSIYAIEREFNARIANMVFDVTNIYTKKAYPNLNRDERKTLENKRLSKVCYDSMLVKLADIIDNCKDLEVAGDFGIKYRDEKKEQLCFLKKGNGILYKRAYNVLYKL